MSDHECPPGPHNITQCEWPTIDVALERIATGRAQLGQPTIITPTEETPSE